MALASLYDGVDLGKDKEKSANLNPTKIAGWSDNLQFMKTQLQLKKASTSKGIKGGKSVLSTGPGNMTLSSIMAPADKQVVLIDEYNPLRPNDYNDFKVRMREKEERERRDKERRREREERERERERRDNKDGNDRRDERRRSPHRDDQDKDRDRDRKRRRDDDRSRDYGGRAAIAPPPSLLETTPVNAEIIQKKENSAGTGGFSTGNVIASQIMAKYGWKEGQGLGREEQGLSTCLQVEKTGKRAGKIINKDVEKAKEKDSFPPPSFPPPSFPPPMGGAMGGVPNSPSQPQPPDVSGNDSQMADLMKNPSKVVLLKNMVGPGEVDGELQPEIEEECTTKYGDIIKVIIFEIPNAQEEEAVRIFVEFKRMESAIKALMDLNNRFFGGRSVSASFYNVDKFRRLDLAS